MSERGKLWWLPPRVRAVMCMVLFFLVVVPVLFGQRLYDASSEFVSSFAESWRTDVETGRRVIRFLWSVIRHGERRD